MTVAKKWNAYNGISAAHFFSERYDHRIGQVVAIILFVAMVGFTSTYIKSLTLLFSPIFPHLSLMVSVITGICFAVLCYVIKRNAGIYTWYWAIFGIPLIFINGFLGSLFNVSEKINHAS